MKNFLSVLVLSVLVTTASFASFPVKNTRSNNESTQITSNSNEVAETTVATSKANKKALKAQLKQVRKTAKRQGDDNTVAIILAVVSVLFFPFGLHNWYLGRKKQALWQTLLTVIGILLAIIIVGFIPLFISWIWQIIDLIKLLTGGLE